MKTKALPAFKGYTIDLRLKQIREVKGQTIEFIDFNSEKGEKILTEYIDSLDTNDDRFKEVLHYL